MSTVPAVVPVLRWEPSPDKAVPTSTRARATARKIREATMRVLAEVDFDDATVADIAAEAGIGSGTVYRYYVDKHDILLSLLAEVEVELIRYTQTAVVPTPGGGIRAREGLLAYLAIYRRYAPLFGAWMTILRPGTDAARSWNQSRHLFVDRFAGFVRRAQRNGEVRQELDADLVAELLMAASERSNYVRVVLGWSSADDEEVADMLSRLFNRGVVVT